MPNPERLNRFLKALSRVLEAYLTLHYFEPVEPAAFSWSYHRCPACKAQRGAAKAECVPYCVGVTHRELAGLPAGRIQTCPNGVTELAVPVQVAGTMKGVLFAGGYWLEEGRPPWPGLVPVPDRLYLEDRLVALRSFARSLGELLAAGQPPKSPNRKTLILEYISANLARKLELAALAAHLDLSPSRTRHLIAELFGVGFSELVRTTKLEQALYLLRTSDLTVAQISHMCGFSDPDYFGRVFRASFGLSPGAKRREMKSAYLQP